MHPAARRNRSPFQLHLTRPEFYSSGSDAPILALGDPLPLYENQNNLHDPPREPGHSAVIISAVSKRRRASTQLVMQQPTK
ncbi:hypothetical protein PanWU01x14_186410 [Parasponia andersonii]|uniref:Uncharacterized protein n=1 Tax=Parasponia andersonii TaxID=3476 RepID=A0A2P5C3V2_PARAD|nr:hypothetical protein PanWU01x14_186410 [Parasponia andersonii]